MVEVDPAILIAGSTAIAALVGVVVCMSSGGGKVEKESPKETKAASSKPKKAEKKAVKQTEVKPPPPTEIKQPEVKQPVKAEVKKAEKKEEIITPLPKKVERVEPPAPPVQLASPVLIEEETKGKKAKETPEQRAARLERQRIAKQKKAEEQAAQNTKESVSSTLFTSPESSFTQPQVLDGWAVVEERRKKKQKAPEVPPPTADSATEEAPPAPTVVADFLTQQVSVDSKKIGGIIGPKGATLHAIQDLTGVTINTPKDRDSAAPVAVSVSGTAEGVATAVKIINELISKGYSKALEGENFNEAAISVKHSYLSDIIGKNGACVRAIQDKTGVKVSIPPSADAKSKVRIGLAGSVEGIAEAKNIITEITTYYHSEVTHPGVVHAALDIPERMYNMIIGTKGAEIKHIQNNFKVSVYIPNADSVIKGVLVVGLKNGVDAATKYIQKIVANLVEEEAQANSIAETWSEQQVAEEQSSDEPWMDQYSFKRDQKVSLISKEGAGILLQKAQANAWKDTTSAEGW